jgi:hypothetical protein
VREGTDRYRQTQCNRPANRTHPASELQPGNKLPEEMQMEMLEDKAQLLLVMTRRLLAASFVITAIALIATSVPFTI